MRVSKLYSIIVPLYFTAFLTALDRTIIVNAIPSITNQFNSIDDIGWYGSAYVLTFCAFQLLFGKIYSFYNPKWVFVTAVVIFEIGSAICGAAPNSTALIIGRAIAGLGSSGIFGGSVIITFFTVPLHLRPIFSGIVSLVIALASVTGPLIGGGFTEHVTWRCSRDLPRFLTGYNGAVMDVFRVALAASCACVVASALMEWKNVKAEKDAMGKPPGPGGPGGPGGPSPGGPGVSPGKEPSTASGETTVKPNGDAGAQV
ncbi:MFS transporter [Penicillium viridicatum]|nr:MFS transporter [Penicillium viridicatum]